eukprot:3948805-Amphidinium_carterae.1
MDITLDESAKGWIVGPFPTLCELSETLGFEPIISRRFPIEQSPKIRPIDELSESFVNGALGQSEKVVMQDADLFVAFLRVLDGVCAGSIEELVLSDGSCLRLDVHADWRARAQLEGKTLDLSGAYKQ